MADIFLSYARADAARIEPLVRLLETRWTVFWDKRVPPGKTWDEYIGGELERSRCVVVAWSKASIASEWVREVGGVTLWRLDGAAGGGSLGSTDGRVDSVAFSPDGRMVAAASSGKKVRLFTLR